MRQLTGSSLALGLVFITKMLPFALASPVAGLVADRFDRRRLMIGADLARAVVVLGFLLIDEPSELPWLYVLTAVQVAIGAFFIPARSASIPNITTPRELLTANALSAATWSTLLALGAALGGVATEAFGVRTVFAIDAATYVVSAAFIFAARIPSDPAPASSGSLLRAAVRDIVDGWRRMRDRPEIGRIALTKPAWALGGAGLVYMLALIGEEVSPAAPALGIGLLYAARGLGTGIGPIAARRFLPDERRWPTMIGWGIAVSGAAYLALGASAWTWWILALVVLAHTPSGANWVLSTVLLQKRTEDRYRGRVFATEWLLVTGVDTLGILAVSVALEAGWVDLRTGVAIFAAVQILTGMAWLGTVARAEGRRAPA